MIGKRFRIFIALIAIFGFTTGLVFPAMADSGADGTANGGKNPAPSQESLVLPATLGKIPFGSQSYAEFKDINIIPDSTGKTVSFTVHIYNGEAAELNLIDYWVTLHSKGGIQFSTRLVPNDREKSGIPAKSSDQLKFYAHINDQTNLTDLVFRFIRWDFSQPNFERVLGSLTVPDSYKNATPLNALRLIQIEGVEAKTRLDRIAMAKNDNYYLPTVDFQIENHGKRSFKLPDFSFFVQTSEGLIYPLKASENKEERVVYPLTQEKIMLNGSIPAKLETKGWKLILAEAINDSEDGAEGKGEILIPVAVYELPEADQIQTDSDKEVGFSTKDGVYTAQLNSITRLPWEDKDQLTASLTISNKGTSSLPIPDFSAYYMLDDAVKVEAQVVRTDKLIGIEGGQQIHLQIIGKIPYTYQFSTIALYLQEKEDENTENDLLQFKWSSAQLSVLNVADPQDSYKTPNVGRRFEYSVRSADTFKGKTSDLFAVHLDVKNLENRYTELPRLVGQFKTPEGLVFPAASTNLETKVRPGGKGLFSIYAAVPKGIDTSQLQLILGQAVTEGQLSEKDQTPDAFVNAVAFRLPPEDKTVLEKFENIQIYPYTLTLKNIKRTIDYLGGEINLEMEYELAKDLLVEANLKDQRVVISVEDDLGMLTFTEEYQLEGEDEEKSLQLGKDILTIQKTDRDLMLKLSSQRTYYLNVYHQFAPGQKKLLASERIFWFNTNRYD